MINLFSDNHKCCFSRIEISEKDLNAYLSENWDMLFPHLLYIKSEFILKGVVRGKDNSGKVDILAFNPQTKKFVVIELKKDFDKNIRTQADDYKSYIEDNFEKIYLNATEKYNATLPKYYDINSNDVEIILITKSFSKRDMQNTEKESSVTLIKYEKFENKFEKLFLYEYINNEPEYPYQEVKKYSEKEYGNIIEKTKDNESKILTKEITGMDSFPEYVKDNIKALKNPENLISKMINYIEEQEEVSWGKLRRVCVEQFGCKNEKQGNIYGNVKTLEDIGYIEMIGSGDSKRIIFLKKDELLNKFDKEEKNKIEKNSNKRVTAGQFEYKEDGIFYFKENPRIELDLKKSIKEVNEQLKMNGLYSKSISSFYYQLRKKSGLI